GKDDVGAVPAVFALVKVNRPVFDQLPALFPTVDKGPGLCFKRKLVLLADVVHQLADRLGDMRKAPDFDKGLLHPPGRPDPFLHRQLDIKPVSFYDPLPTKETATHGATIGAWFGGLRKQGPASIP